MQLFGFNMDVAGLQLRFSIGFDDGGSHEALKNGRPGLRLEDLPRFELSRD